MVLAKVTSKGQVTIPLEVRRKLALETGSKIDFVQTPEGKIVIEPVRSSISSLEGILHRSDREPVSLDDMQDAIAMEVGKNRHGSMPGPSA